MKAYKGFDKNLKCRDFQYEIGKTYHEDEALMCEQGFHACGIPIDCFWYYPPSKSRYAQANLFGKVGMLTRDFKISTDSKICGTDITIEKELTIPQMVDESINEIMRLAKDKYKAVSTNIDDVAGSIHKESVACTLKPGSIAACTGENSLSRSRCNYSIAATTSRGGVSVSEGQASIACSTYSSNAITSTGFNSISASTANKSFVNTQGKASVAVGVGRGSMIVCDGINSVAICAGKNTLSACEVTKPDSIAISWNGLAKCRGVIGSYLLFYDNELVAPETDQVKLVFIDGIKYKPNTWYYLNGLGDICEATEEVDDE